MISDTLVGYVIILILGNERAWLYRETASAST